MFVHDFVMVHRPFGEVAARFHNVLCQELASIVMTSSAGTSSRWVPTVVIGDAQHALDALVIPVEWTDGTSGCPVGLEGKLELSSIDQGCCDLHLMGSCTVGESGAPVDERRRKRAVVLTARSVLESLREQLERPQL